VLGLIGDDATGLLIVSLLASRFPLPLLAPRFTARASRP
jgi:hypothetical protein